MNRLAAELVKGILSEAEVPRKEVVGMFGGGFKPPTVGHLEVVKRALDENPEMDKMVILVGSGERDSITQAESLAIWRIYQKYLPKKVEVQPAPEGKAPIAAVYSYAKNNPDKEVYWFLGAREGNEDDSTDIIKRTKSLQSGNYPNVTVKKIITGGTVSGTKTRKALLARDKETFIQALPDIPEIDQIWDMLSDTMGINEEKNPIQMGDKFFVKKGAFIYHEGKKKRLKRGKFFTVKEINDNQYSLTDKQNRQFWVGKHEMCNKWDNISLKERVNFNADFISKGDVEFVDDMADKRLAPVDVDLSGNHFFDRLNDPRNFPDISIEELEEFFDKLADEKEEFIDFLKKYKDVVVKDTDTNINIPFMKLANKAIAKTIMRKKNFKTPNKVLPLQEINWGNAPSYNFTHNHNDGVVNYTFHTDANTDLDVKFFLATDSSNITSADARLNTPKLPNHSASHAVKYINTIGKVTQHLHNNHGVDWINFENTGKTFNLYSNAVPHYFPNGKVLGDNKGATLVINENKLPLLLEGRYDQEVLKQSRFVINKFREEFGKEYEGSEKRSFIGYVGGKKKPVTYKLELYFYPDDFDTLGPSPFIINAGAGDEPMIYIQINYNPDSFPEAYSELVPEVKDALRHEIEHVSQYSFDKGVMPDGVDQDSLPLFDYLTLDYEIPAFVQGLYKSAKTKKITLTKAIQDFLDDRAEELSPEEEAEVMKIWTDWAKKNLPAAQINEANPLKEVGEGSSKPFPYKEDAFPLEYIKDYGIGRIEYTVKAEAKGEPIDIRVSGNFKRRRSKIKGGEKEYGLLDFQFGPTFGTDKTPTINDKTYMFRLIATLLEILKEINSKIKISFIGYEAEPRRHKLYTLIIKKAFPNATVTRSERGSITQWDLYESKDPKKGTGKKPKGSGRRLYTDEDPSDTVKVKFSTRQDIVDTLSKKSFKAKSHARQSQVINLIHQRVRAAYGRAKKPEVKKRLKTALDYITKRKEASKAKTKRLQAQKKKTNEALEGAKRIDYYLSYYINVSPSTFDVAKEDNNIIISGINNPYPQGFDDTKDTRQVSPTQNLNEGDTYEKMAAKGKKAGNLKQGTVRKRLNIPKGEKVPMYKINKEISRLKKMDKDKDKKGVQLGDKNQKYYKALQLAKTLKSTTNVDENVAPNHNQKSAPYGSGYKQLKEEITPQIISLTQYMGSNGLNLKPYPKIKFIDNDVKNAEDLLGRTAYYDPNQQLIALYTMGRHPKDILRSYAHELVHHHQNLNNTLDHSQTTNTNKDDDLDRIEREAYETGNILFRNWEDSIKNGK